jgi:hypothetical protein
MRPRLNEVIQKYSPCSVLRIEAGKRGTTRVNYHVTCLPLRTIDDVIDRSVIWIRSLDRFEFATRRRCRRG